MFTNKLKFDSIAESVTKVIEQEEKELLEAIQQITEKLDKSASIGDWISDFVHSNDPRFAGKSAAKRREMAIGAYYKEHPSKRRKDVKENLKGDQYKLDKNKNGKLDSQDFKILRKEEVEELDELSKETLSKYMKGARKDISVKMKGGEPPEGSKRAREIEKRAKGYRSAWNKLQREETKQIQELKKSTLGSYIKKAAERKADLIGTATSAEKRGTEAGDILADRSRKEAEKHTKGIERAVSKLTKEELSLDEQFDIIEEMIENMAKEYGVDSEVIWEDFEDVDDETLMEVAAWQRKEGKSPTGGLNKKGIASYRRENPGSKLSMAVTTKPSKLKPGSKAAKRRKSFCARMGGMKGAMKDEHGRPTRKALALRKWNCHEAIEEENLIEMKGANLGKRHDFIRHITKELGYSHGGADGPHDVYTHPERPHLSVPRHKELKAPLVLALLKRANSKKE